MTMANESIKALMRRMLKDIRIDVASEFDRNFETQSFFGQAWQRHRSPTRQGGHILMKTGALRRSIAAKTDDSGITFSSDLPYAAIHNEGGDIKVTRRMKAYFWAMYYKANGGLGRRKDGTLRKDKRNEQLTTEAEFWKRMALMKVGSVIKMPQRRFIGNHPDLEENVKAIIKSRTEEFLNNPNTYKK